MAAAPSPTLVLGARICFQNSYMFNALAFFHTGSKRKEKKKNKKKNAKIVPRLFHDRLRVNHTYLCVCNRRYHFRKPLRRIRPKLLQFSTSHIGLAYCNKTLLGESTSCFVNPRMISSYINRSDETSSSSPIFKNPRVFFFLHRTLIFYKYKLIC